MTEGAKRSVSITAKRSKGSTVELDVRWIAPDGTAFDVVAAGGKEKPKPNVYKAKLKDVPQTGLWRLEIRGANATTGAFSLGIKAKDALNEKGNRIVGVGQQIDVPFVFGEGVEITLSAKRGRQSQIVPDVVLVDAAGNEVPETVGAAAVNTKKGSLKLKKIVVPTFGTYSLRFTGREGTGGELTYSLKTKVSKFKGDPPTADAGDASHVEPGVDGRLNASGSAAAVGASLGFQWTQVHGPVVELDDATSEFATFEAPLDDTASLGFQLSVVEAGVRSRPSLVVVEVARPPIAIAGPSQSVAGSALVSLDSTASIDRRGQGLSADWRVIAGGVSLDDPGSATPTFTAPNGPVTVRLGLTMDDGRATSREVEQIVVVGDAGASVADAGAEQIVSRMATVHLSGLGSIRPGGVLSDGAEWTQISGPPVDLDGADTFFPAFTAPREFGELLFELTVDGSAGTTHRTCVRVRPDEENLAPDARTPGPVFVSGGNVALDARTTVDPNGDATSRRWVQTAGPLVPIAAPGDLLTQATGLLATDVVWQFAVQARDELAFGAPDFVRASASQIVGPPLASAGADRTIVPGNLITLDGAASLRTDGGNGLTYAWEQVSGTDWFDVLAEVPTFDPTLERPTFAVPTDLSSLTPTRTLSFELVVNDTTTSSVPDRVTITVAGLPRNGVPLVTAAASATNPLPGTAVQLIGTATDRDGDDVSVVWTRVSGPFVSLSPGNAVLSPTFMAPPSGTLVFRIDGNDGFDDATPAEVTIIVDAKPTAVATVDPLNGEAGTDVTFDGRGSSDPEGEDLTFTWTQTSGSAVVFPASGEQFTVTSPVGGMAFSLVVNDGRQDSDLAVASFSTITVPTVAPTASKITAAYGGSVTLNANPSATPSGTTFVWRQVSGRTVQISNVNAQNPTFTGPLPSTSPFGSAPSATFGVTPSLSGQTGQEGQVTVNFFASFNNGAAAGGGSNTVYGIVQSRCLNCHRGSNSSCPVGSGGNALGFGMATASAFRNNAIGTNACASSKKRVQTLQPGNSFLVDRLKGIGGSRMPTSGAALSTLQINLIEDWITQGAQNN